MLLMEIRTCVCLRVQQRERVAAVTKAVVFPWLGTTTVVVRNERGSKTSTLPSR